jgi:hypothetical protein
MVWALRVVAGFVLAGSSMLPKGLASLGLPTAMHDLAGAYAICGAWHSMPTRSHTPAVRVFRSAGHMLHTSATPTT